MWAEELKALLAKVRTLEQEGNLAKAREALDAAPEAVKAFGSWHYAAGALAARGNEWSGAVAAFEEAVKREPELPEFKANLGAALLEKAKAKEPGALERATQVLTEACAQSPRLPNSHTNLGMAKLLSGDAKAALESFDRALRIDPKDVVALYDRAAALNQLGRLDECLECLERLLAIQPSFPPALQSRERTLSLLGKR